MNADHGAEAREKNWFCSWEGGSMSWKREWKGERRNEAALCQEKAVCYWNWPPRHPVVSRKFYEITQYCVWAASLNKLYKRSHCGWRIIWGKTVIPEGHKGKWSGNLLTDRALSVEDSQAPCPELQAHTPDCLLTSPLGWEKSTSNVKSPSPKSLPPQRLPITGNIPTIQWIAQAMGSFSLLWFQFQIRK